MEDARLNRIAELVNQLTEHNASLETELKYYKDRSESLEKAFNELSALIQLKKDNHNENREDYPINYGTICELAMLCSQLKEEIDDTTKRNCRECQYNATPDEICKCTARFCHFMQRKES